MKFDDKQVYNKPADTVIKMFSDKAYFENKYQKLGYSNIEVLEHVSDGNRFSITVRYSAKSNAPIPGFAKKFLGDTNVVTQTDSWDLSKKTGRLQAEIRGVPVKVTADMTLVDEGGGAVNRLKWNLSSSIPLIGGKLEGVVASDIQSKAKLDQATSSELLQGY